MENLIGYRTDYYHQCMIKYDPYPHQNAVDQQHSFSNGGGGLWAGKGLQMPKQLTNSPLVASTYLTSTKVYNKLCPYLHIHKLNGSL